MHSDSQVNSNIRLMIDHYVNKLLSKQIFVIFKNSIRKSTDIIIFSTIKILLQMKRTLSAL